MPSVTANTPRGSRTQSSLAGNEMSSVHLSVEQSQEGPALLSDSDEELLNRPLDPGDDMYRGKGSTCVVTVPNPVSSHPRRSRRRERSSTVLSHVENEPPSRKRDHVHLDEPHDRPLAKRSNRVSRSDPKPERTMSMFIDNEAAADESDLSELDDSSMDEDDVDFIDDGPIAGDPVDLYVAPRVSSPSPINPVVPPPQVVTTPHVEPLLFNGGASPKSHTLGSPFNAGASDQPLDSIIQKALKNKDFLMALLRSVASENSTSASPQSNVDVQASSTAGNQLVTLNLPSPIATMLPLNPSTPALLCTPPQKSIPMPATPTKPRGRGRPKAKGKATPTVQPKRAAAAARTRAVPLIAPDPTGLGAPTSNPIPALPTLTTPPPSTSNQITVPASFVPGSFMINIRSPTTPAVSNILGHGLPTPISPTPVASTSTAQPLVPTTPTPGAGTPRMLMSDLALLLPAGFVPAGDPNAAPGNTKSLRLCPPLPEVCEVNDPTLHDPLLTETYAGLVKLKKGRFSSWSTNIGRGQVVFSTWVTKTPQMNPNTAYSAITLTQSGRFINGSRLSPLEVQLREIRHNNTLRYNVYRGDVPAIALSCGYLWDSFVTQPKPYGLRQKMVSVVLHKQEWERLVAFSCMIFNIDVIAAQVSQSALQFSTRSDWAAGYNDLPDATPAPVPSPTGDDHMFTHSPSVATQTSSTTGNISEAMALSANSIVPVYDARDTDFNFQSDIGDLETLRRWEGEIPRGSFVVVGYTLAAYFPNQKWNLATNLRWVVVVGIPAI